MDLKYYKKKQLNEIKYLNEIAKAYKDRVSSFALRKQFLDDQKKYLYRSEYDRIRSHLENSSIPFETKQGLKNRAQQLQLMGARAVDVIN
jgi:hypothetical protein